MRKLLLSIFALVLVACGPQAAMFEVEVKDMQGVNVNMEGKQIAVFSLSSVNVNDSVRTSNAALSFGEKLRQDRGFENPLPVFSVSQLDFAGFNDGKEFDRQYLKDLMLTTGADLQLFVHSLRFHTFNVKSSVHLDADYSQSIVDIPYSAGLHIYDALEDSLVFSMDLRDTVYMNVLSGTGKTEYNALVASKLPEISTVVGEALAGKITQQWNLQQRMLVNFPDNQGWEKPLALAMEFKWKEAIELWMPFTKSRNYRIASYAAYNIAVGCEMLERFELAREWAEFSVKRYKFRENEELRMYLKRKSDIR